MHYLLLEAIKLGTMQEFCHVVPDHLICWAIFNVNVVFGLLISDIEVSDVEMMRALACTLVSIGLEQHSALVIVV